MVNGKKTRSNYNPRQNLLSQTKIFSIFRQKSRHLLIQLQYSVNPPSPQVNVVCLDSGDVLHDFFRVTEINNIDLGGKGGHLLFRSTFFRFVTRVLARIVVSFWLQRMGTLFIMLFQRRERGLTIHCNGSVVFLPTLIGRGGLKTENFRWMS